MQFLSYISVTHNKSNCFSLKLTSLFILFCKLIVKHIHYSHPVLGNRLPWHKPNSYSKAYMKLPKTVDPIKIEDCSRDSQPPNNGRPKTSTGPISVFNNYLSSLMSKTHRKGYLNFGIHLNQLTM